MSNPTTTLVTLKRDSMPQSARPWVVRIALAAVVLALLIYIRWVIASKEREIAKLKTEQELHELKLREAKVAADNARFTAASAQLRKEAEELEGSAFVMRETLRQDEEALASDKKKVEAVRSGDWEALNRAAGVIP